MSTNFWSGVEKGDGSSNLRLTKVIARAELMCHIAASRKEGKKYAEICIAIAVHRPGNPECREHHQARGSVRKGDRRQVRCHGHRDALDPRPIRYGRSRRGAE